VESASIVPAPALSVKPAASQITVAAWATHGTASADAIVGTRLGLAARSGPRRSVSAAGRRSGSWLSPRRGWHGTDSDSGSRCTDP